MSFLLFFSNSNLEDLMRGLRMFNTLIGDEDDSNGLLKAARNLSDAFGNFLGALDPSSGKVRQFTKKSRKWFLKVRLSFQEQLS